MYQRQRKLFIIAPDNFYCMLLRQAQYENFKATIVGSIEALENRPRKLAPEAIVWMTRQLSTEVLVEGLSRLRRLHPTSRIAHAHMGGLPVLTLIHHERREMVRSRQSLPFGTVGELITHLEAWHI
jgi:hypothetical protein